jgi:hypothetical protein
MDSPASPNSLDLDRTLAVAGSAAASFARLWQALWVQPYVAPPLLEMCRLTLARLHRDEHELAAANPHLQPGTLPPGRRATVIAGKAHAAADFSVTEKAVLEFAEAYGLDTQAIPDVSADAVKTQLGEAGLVFLIEALGCLDARMRTARCLRDLQRFAPGADAHAG